MTEENVKTTVPLTDEQLAMLCDAVVEMISYIDNNPSIDNGSYRAKWVDLKAYLKHQESNRHKCPLCNMPALMIGKHLCCDHCKKAF
jgi:hypothetical protein